MLLWVGMISPSDLHSQQTKVYWTFFTEHGRNHGRSNTYSSILNIFIHFGDIRHRNLKSSEIASNFACFWPLIFFGEGPSNVQTQFSTFSLLHTTVQNSVAICQRSSEILWQNQKNICGKHKYTLKTIVSGQT